MGVNSSQDFVRVEKRGERKRKSQEEEEEEESSSMTKASGGRALECQ